MSFSPATLSNINTATQLISGIGKGVLQFQQAGLEARTLEFAAGEQMFAAAAEEFNASIARQEARLVQAAAKLDISRKRKAGERLVSQQQALFAASGVRIDEGTPIVIMQDTFEETELDVLITQFNADMESQRMESVARQAEFAAEQKRFTAEQQRFAARQARRAGRIRAGTTLLETAATFAQKFPTTKTIEIGSDISSGLAG